MIDYYTLQPRTTLYPDAHLRALIRAKYGEYASKSYYILDVGTLQGRTVKKTKTTQYIWDDGTVSEPKVEEWEDHEWARPLLLTHGDGQNKKCSLDWAEIRAFRPTTEQVAASTPPTKRKAEKRVRSDVSEADKRAFLELAKKLGLSVEDINL